MRIGSRPRRGAYALVAMLVVIGSVTVLGVAPALAEISDADCDTLLSSENWSNSDADSTPAALGETADAMNDTADDIDDAKLKKGIKRMASVYEAASRARNVTAAGIVFGEKAKTWAKGFKVYAKALNTCTTRSLEDSLDSNS